MSSSQAESSFMMPKNDLATYPCKETVDWQGNIKLVAKTGNGTLKDQVFVQKELIWHNTTATFDKQCDKESVHSTGCSSTNAVEEFSVFIKCIRRDAVFCISFTIKQG
jgi:hypothetical protein